MTWPTASQLIGYVLVGVIAAMIYAAQHGHGTTPHKPPDPPDGEQP
ncbi:hypothetical protein ACWCPT_29675 [Streptomyces sp. NPDC002308]